MTSAYIHGVANYIFGDTRDFLKRETLGKEGIWEPEMEIKSYVLKELGYFLLLLRKHLYLFIYIFWLFKFLF